FRQPAAHRLAGVLRVRRIEILNELRILDARRVERRAAVGALLVRAADGLVADEHLRHLAGAHRLLELAVRDLPALRRHEPRLREREEEKEAEDVPHCARPARRQRAPVAGALVSWIHPWRGW